PPAPASIHVPVGRYELAPLPTRRSSDLCDFGAKSDPVSTVIPTAKETGNFELRTNAYARKVTHEDGKATGVLFVDMRTGIEYEQDRKSTRLNSSHVSISYAVFCLKKKTT